MSPLVVAYALAGSVVADLVNEPRKRTWRKNVYKEIWPTMEEINAVAGSAFDPDTYQSSTAMLSTRMSFGMKFLTLAARCTNGTSTPLTSRSLLFQNFSMGEGG